MMSGTTAYAPLTDMQVAVVLRTALSPNNRFLPVNNPIRIPFLLKLVFALEDVKKVSRRPYGGLLDELVHSLREILRIGRHSQLRGDVLSMLGIDLSDRFDENGIKQDLEDSINAFKDCLATANHSDLRRIRLYMLGSHQAILCMKFGSTNNIDETISTFNECLKLYPGTLGIDNQPGDDTFLLSGVRSQLGFLHFRRFKFRSEESHRVTSIGPRTGLSNAWEEDLNLAIFNLAESHRLLHICNQPIPWASRGILADYYISRFRWFGSREGIKKSIELCRIAITESSSSDESYPDILSNLANHLHTRYNTYGCRMDLHEAILHIERALELRPDNTTYRRERAGMYQSRFMITNDVGDLDAAISETRKCLDSNTLQGSRQGLAVRQLARTLKQRFQTTWVVEDLEEAIEMVRDLVDELRRDVTARSNSDDWDVFCQYGGLLREKFEVTGDIKDLHESHSQYETALRLVPYHSDHRPTIIQNFAGLLSRLYERTYQMEHLNKSIVMYHEANGFYRGGDADNLYHCGASLLRRVKRTHKRNKGELDGDANRDLKDALNHLCDAVVLVNPDHPTRSQIQAALARAFLFIGGSRNQRVAFDLFESAVTLITATPRDCLLVGRNWITNAIELQDFKEATRAYSHTMNALYRLLSTNPTLVSQYQLINFRSLKCANFLSQTFASDATHIAIKAGDPKRAVELLEQGRGLLWSRLNHYQYPLDRLRDVEPILAKKYEELSKRLENLAISPVSLELRRATDKMMEELHVASKEWDEVVEQIRKLDGFSDFLKPLRYDSLRKAATDGPVIIINVSNHHRCSEAIIIHNQDDPVVISLPDASSHQIYKYWESLEVCICALRCKRYGPRGDSLDDSDNSYCLVSSNSEERKEYERAVLKYVLRSLWKSIVQPVVKKLQELSIQPGSRIWWCPTSIACELPLHAAGPYKEGEHNLYDLYISSYLRYLSSSHHVRQATNLIPEGKHATSPTQLLVISCPGELGERGYLHHVEREVEEIRRCFSFIDTSSVPKVLDGPQANLDSVIAHLPQYPWVHFSCHGNQHPEPFRSSFEVYGREKVTLLHLMQARNPDAELAFLSACNTATGNTFGTPDEVIHLVSTLQFVGFKSVVGTLWAMCDADAPDLARDFYGYLLGEGKADYRMSAVALHEAMKRMRERGVPLEQWVNFVHFGA